MLVSRTLAPPSLELATAPPPEVAPGVSVVGVGTRAAREDHSHQGIGRTVYPGQDLQDAIDAAADAGGGLVTLMPGVHTPPTAILVRPNVSIRGIEGHPFLTRVVGTFWADGVAGFMAFTNFAIEGIFFVGSLGGVGSAFLIFREMAFQGDHANVNIPGFPPPATVPGFAINDTGYGLSFVECSFQGDGEAGFGAQPEISADFIDCELRGTNSPPVALALGGGWNNLTVYRCRFRGAVHGTPSKPATFRAVDCLWQNDGGQTHLTTGNNDVTWELVRARVDGFGGSPPLLGDSGSIRVDDVYGAVLGPDGSGSTAPSGHTLVTQTTATVADPGNVVSLVPLPPVDVISCVGDGAADFDVLLPPSSRTPQGVRVLLVNGQDKGVMTVVPDGGGDTIRADPAIFQLDWSADQTGVELLLAGTNWQVLAIRGAIP